MMKMWKIGMKWKCRAENYSAVALIMMALSGCSGGRAEEVKPGETADGREQMVSEVKRIADGAKGTVGVAMVCEGDTMTINNEGRYAMMSVFKLHECLAVANALESSGISLDTLINVRAAEMDRQTWSPMNDVYREGDFTIPASELMRRALIDSDNNASNLLFSHVVTPSETDAFIRTIAPDTCFAIKYTEAEMKAQHERAYDNYSTPLSAALLIAKVFRETIISSDNQELIRTWLSQVTTGHDRLGAAVEVSKGITFAHKTGSGYRNDAGKLMAFNDVAYFELADGRWYSLSVMIRDFAGTDDEAAKVMAEISQTVYRHMATTSKDEANSK